MGPIYGQNGNLGFYPISLKINGSGNFRKTSCLKVNSGSIFGDFQTLFCKNGNFCNFDHKCKF